jgi:hypothetical protein
LEARVASKVLSLLTMLQESTRISGAYSDASNFLRRELWRLLVSQSGIEVVE